MNRILSVGLVGLLSIALLGCAQNPPVPSGGQQVHVTVTDTAVRAEPAQVAAGDVYLVLESSPHGSMEFVEGLSGPLTDAQLKQVADGGTLGTSIVAFNSGGCSADQDAANRGRMGPCGNVLHLTLAPGKYAIVGGGAEGQPQPMAVLEVKP